MEKKKKKKKGTLKLSSAGTDFTIVARSNFQLLAPVYMKKGLYSKIMF